MRDDAALAPAAVAHRHVHELAEDALLGAPHLAAAVALRAALRLRARLRPQTVAHRAQFRRLHLELLLDAEDRLLKRQRERPASVGAARWAALGARLCAAEERVEDVTQPADPEPLEAAREAVRAALRRRVTEAVVQRALLRVGEHLVRLVHLLEAGFCLRLLVAVRVELHRQLTERLFQLFRACTSG